MNSYLDQLAGELWCCKALQKMAPVELKGEEYFLKFVPVTDLSGKELALTVLKNLSRIGIDVSKILGQGYDGAAAMSGRLNGA